MKYKFLFILPVAVSIIFITVYGSTATRNAKKGSAHYLSALRLVGHKLLLSAGDTHSRVLPVKQLSEEVFQIRFENPLALMPDSLVSIISRTAKSASLPANYTANVSACAGDEIVYSFVMADNANNTIVPCLGRNLPVDCYYITFHFSKPGLTATHLLAGSFALLLPLAYFVYHKNRRKITPAINAKEEEITGNIILPVGRFLFYVDQRYLQLNDQRIDLTDKETKLLSILAAAPNQVVDRDRLQKEIWESEGVIVTRSLDVFISKLRKKLKPDTGIRIVNIHGKGYKLELATA